MPDSTEPPVGGTTVSNACTNSASTNFSQIEVTTSGDDGLNTVLPGGATTTSGLAQTAAIPGAIFAAGYNLGLLQLGVNTVPISVQTKIEATNTVQGTQTTNTVGGTPPDHSVEVTTTITDPNGTPGTGDETGTAGSFAVSYADLSWTAGASGTINYRQDSIATAPPTLASNTLLINVLLERDPPNDDITVQFRCAPGTVTRGGGAASQPTGPAEESKEEVQEEEEEGKAGRRGRQEEEVQEEEEEEVVERRSRKSGGHTPPNG